MQIQEFSEEFREQVIQLWQACQLTAPWNDPNKDIDRKLLVNPELFLLGVLDDELVATVMGGYEGHRGWANYLAVKQRYRKHGFGRQMMTELEARLTAIGCPKINLQVRDANLQVIAFYEALGYGNDHVVGLGKRLIKDD
ncbi:GNAT family acetyltransferase [Marinomonas sp. THO17]|uniref:GNAT family acetyltransferase n=1 Tax=Marinomonas sp. THO17 TaxID=3149048 RepID=UPI00336BE012